MRLLLTILFLFLSLFSQAKDYYVAKTGNDRNAGTEASPFLTIQKGLDKVSAGGTVYVRKGTYQDYVRFVSSGSAGNPITLKNFGNDIVTVDAQNSRVLCINTNGKSYLVVDGIKVQNSTSYNFLINSGNITVKNCISELPVVKEAGHPYNFIAWGNPSWISTIVFNNCNASGGTTGISIIGKVDGLTITGGEFTDDYGAGIDINGEYTGKETVGPQNIIIDGVDCNNCYIQGINTNNTVNVTIRNSHCSYNGATGIQIESNTHDVLIEDNTCDHNCQIATSETGIWVYKSHDVIVRRNIINSNQSGLRFWETENFQAYNNLIYDNRYRTDENCTVTSGVDFDQSSGTFYNNTLSGNSDPTSEIGSLYISSTGVNHITIKNNIISGDGSHIDMTFKQANGSKVVSDYNLIHNTRTINVAMGTTKYTWRAYKAASGQDKHSVNDNPEFISSANFQLKPGSPAINAGVGVGLTTDFLSNPIIGLPDIGAYEGQKRK